MTDLPAINLSEYRLVEPVALKNHPSPKEVVVIARTGAMISGTVKGLWDDSLSVDGVHNVPMAFSQIERLWVKRPPCPHNTLRRCYEGSRALIYFICADDDTPWCHQQFTVDPFGDPTVKPDDR